MSDDQQLQTARQFISGLPHAHELGLYVEDIGSGWAVFTMPFADKLIGDPETGVLAGGAVSTLLDTTCGAAVMSHPEGAEATATLDLRIDYMRAANPGQTIRAEAECYHVTRSVAFVRAVALDDDRDRPVATASGAFTFSRPDGAAEGAPAGRGQAEGGQP